MDPERVQEYHEFFAGATGRPPHLYQVQVARELATGHHVVVRAPTGAGKTWAAVLPLFFPGWVGRPSRLIYALPLRTLAEGAYESCRELLKNLGVNEEVTLQTGEQPDDPFFDRGRVVVTTYDQLLSGLLCSPYGLSGRLNNVNAAAVTGALVVFDEFHLMGARTAFLTAAAALNLFRDLCLSVWMTATATDPLVEVLEDALGACQVPSGREEFRQLVAGLPAVTSVCRRLVVEREPMSAAAVLGVHQNRSLVVCNTVGRAQAMYLALRQECGPDRVILLHSRFLKEDRRRKEEEVRRRFGPRGDGGGILVATQVIEAGLDISCEHLHTEVCPVNALVQRAGRCARFPGEAGVVHVYPLPEGASSRPYRGQEIEAAARIVGERPQLTPEVCAEWVQLAHGEEDAMALREGWRTRREECLRRIQENALGGRGARVADLIREVDNVRVVLADSPPQSPAELEGMAVPRTALMALVRRWKDGTVQGWAYVPAEDQVWVPLRPDADLRWAYAVCLAPSVAAYDPEVGLRLGERGTCCSPPRRAPERPGWRPLQGELWRDHAAAVAAEVNRRLDREGPGGGLAGRGFSQRAGVGWETVRRVAGACAVLHDLGKLQADWQLWARAAMRVSRPGFEPARALAHTDFNPDSAEDRERERSLGVRRPPHAAAGAYYSRLFLPGLLRDLDERLVPGLAACAVAAILAHHGGWLPAEPGLRASPLWDGWAEEAAEVVGWSPERRAVDRASAQVDKKGVMYGLLQVVVGPDQLGAWWPLVAYLVRCLRLSDQRATAEVGLNE